MALARNLISHFTILHLGQSGFSSPPASPRQQVCALALTDEIKTDLAF